MQICFYTFHVAHDSDTYIQNLERSPGKCMSSEMSRFVRHRQESPLTFGNRKSVDLGVSTSLANVVDVNEVVIIRLFCVSKLTILKKS